MRNKKSKRLRKELGYKVDPEKVTYKVATYIYKNEKGEIVSKKRTAFVDPTSLRGKYLKIKVEIK